MTYIVLFIISVLFSLRKILLSTRLIGHNWDYSFPYPQELFSKIHYYSSYTWVDHNLGSIPTMNISQYLPNIVLSNFGKIFGSVFSTKLLFIVILFIAFFGFKKLLDYLIAKRDSNYLFSFLFAFSPFLFNEIIGGSWYMWISYAISPLLSLFTLRFIINDNKKALIPLILCIVVVISSLQNVFSLSILLVLFISYRGFVEKNLQSYMRRGVILSLFILGINSYWILNFIVSIGDFSKDVLVNSTFAGTFHGVRVSTQTILNIFNLSGYLDRNMYYFTFSEGIKSLFVITFPILWVLIINALFQHDKKKASHKDFLFWFTVYFVSIFIVKGGNNPFPDLSMQIFTSLPIMKLYRSPQHLMFIPSFIIPLLIAYLYDYYQQNNNIKKYLYIFFSLTVFLWISGWILTGDFGMKTLLKQNKDHADLFKLSSGLKSLYHEIELDPLEGRTMFLPSVASPKFLKTSYQNQAQGSIPEYPYLDKPTFVAEQNIFANLFEKRFCKKSTFDYINYLSLFSVKNIIVRRDIQALYSDCGVKFNSDRAIEILDKDARLSKKYIDQYLVKYSINPVFFVPLLFIPTDVEIIYKSYKDLPSLVSTPGFSIGKIFYFINKKMPNTDIISKYSKPNKNTPLVAYKKINPIKYKIRLRNITAKFPLIFNTSFHPNWKLYLDDEIQTKNTGFVSKDYIGTRQNNTLQSGTWYETLFKNILISEKDHFSVNGYANAWMIDPKQICETQHCKKYSDGSYDINLILYFNQQNILYLGLGLSALTFLCAFWYVKKRN